MGCKGLAGARYALEIPCWLKREGLTESVRIGSVKATIRFSADGNATQKMKRAANSRSLLPGWHPPPKVRRQNRFLLLVERCQGLASAFAGDRGARGLNANHSIFK